MKKLLALLLCGILCIGLAACAEPAKEHPDNAFLSTPEAEAPGLPSIDNSSGYRQGVFTADKYVSSWLNLYFVTPKNMVALDPEVNQVYNEAQFKSNPDSYMIDEMQMLAADDFSIAPVTIRVENLTSSAETGMTAQQYAEKTRQSIESVYKNLQNDAVSIHSDWSLGREVIFLNEVYWLQYEHTQVLSDGVLTRNLEYWRLYRIQDKHLVTFVFTDYYGESDLEYFVGLFQPLDGSPAQTDVAQKKPDADVLSLLLAVLSDQQSFTANGEQGLYLREYLASQYNAEPIRYTFLDFDGDGQPELAVESDCDQAAWVIFHYDGIRMHAYPFGARGMLQLKADGSFDGSNSADSSAYMRMTFPEGLCTVTKIAWGDYAANTYFIEGQSCTEEAWNDYIAQWHHRSDAVMIPLENQSAEEPAPTQAAKPQKLCSRCSKDCSETGLTSGMCKSCYNATHCRECGERTKDLEDGMCPSCVSWNTKYACDECGEMYYPYEMFEGVCDKCNPYGGLGPDAFCSECGANCSSSGTIDGKCEDCYYSYCSECGERTNDLENGMCSDCVFWNTKFPCHECGELVYFYETFEGVCDKCNPYGGLGPDAFCSECGANCSSSGTIDGKCEDCYYGK